jgi:hypothetical protein
MRKLALTDQNEEKSIFDADNMRANFSIFSWNRRERGNEILRSIQLVFDA